MRSVLCKLISVPSRIVVVSVTGHVSMKLFTTVFCVSLACQELAEQSGDADKVSELAKKLEELEERAEELDKQRSKGLSAIRYGNIHVGTLHWRVLCTVVSESSMLKVFCVAKRPSLLCVSECIHVHLYVDESLYQ